MRLHCHLWQTREEFNAEVEQVWIQVRISGGERGSGRGLERAVGGKGLMALEYAGARFSSCWVCGPVSSRATVSSAALLGSPRKQSM